MLMCAGKMYQNTWTGHFQISWMSVRTIRFMYLFFFYVCVCVLCVSLPVARHVGSKYICAPVLMLHLFLPSHPHLVFLFYLGIRPQQLWFMSFKSS